MFSPMNGQFWTYQAYREELERTTRRYQLIQAALEGRLETAQTHRSTSHRNVQQGPGLGWRIRHTARVLWHEFVSMIRSLPQLISRTLLSNNQHLNPR